MSGFVGTMGFTISFVREFNVPYHTPTPYGGRLNVLRNTSRSERIYGYANTRMPNPRNVSYYVVWSRAQGLQGSRAQGFKGSRAGAGMDWSGVGLVLGWIGACCEGSGKGGKQL